MAASSLLALPLAAWGARAAPGAGGAVLLGHGLAVVGLSAVLALQAPTRTVGLGLGLGAALAWGVAVAAAVARPPG